MKTYIPQNNKCQREAIRQKASTCPHCIFKPFLILEPIALARYHIPETTLPVSSKEVPSLTERTSLNLRFASTISLKWRTPAFLLPLIILCRPSCFRYHLMIVRAAAASSTIWFSASRLALPYSLRYPSAVNVRGSLICSAPTARPLTSANTCAAPSDSTPVVSRTAMRVLRRDTKFISKLTVSPRTPSDVTKASVKPRAKSANSFKRARRMAVKPSRDDCTNPSAV